MGMLSRLWMLGLVAIIPGKAFLDLNGTLELEGTWRAPVTLPCVYQPLPGFKEISVIWKVTQQNQSPRTIFHRDATSGDQTLMASFQGRLSVTKEPPGVVSLHIKALEMTDVGRYVCEVLWETISKRRLTRERTTTLRVVKVPVTKPVIQFGSNASILHTGMNLTLTCLARGSPPFTYRWLKIVPGDAASLVGQDATLRFEKLELFDAGKYYCEAKNRIGTLQRSNTVQLNVEENLATPDREPSEGQVPRKASLPLYLVIVIALLCALLVFTVFAVTFFRRRTKLDHSYQVTYRNNSMNVRSEGSAGSTEVARPCECPYEEPGPRAQNPYTEEPTGGTYMMMNGTGNLEEVGYEPLLNKMESEYELLGGK